ncbi:MAG: double-stranded uracil-DNA glycosylase [Thiomicrorhabdus sp.]|nr:MAG: double-stranded uracil-DNA glycosylase [Thiomicrorhabdus sp.]
MSNSISVKINPQFSTGLLKVSHCSGFPPIIPKTPKILILGTMPSVVSIEEAFYYAHPRNAFWPMIASLLNNSEFQVGGVDQTAKSLNTVKEKKEACNILGIYLWDVLQACERKGSLDSEIKLPQANDFSLVFREYPSIKTVAFNGQAAQKLFKKEVLKLQDLPDDLTYITLPSTSPAYAAITLEDKRLFWQEKLSDLL